MSNPINAVSLAKILKELPTPNQSGILWQAELLPRDMELKDENFSAPRGFEEYQVRILLFRSMELRSRSGRRWYEWELVAW